ncbi:hypothetical protein SPRG_08521 [Saprolegnia parasitica CBS 223.65]|uniref:F-box domain-containing protein n=1 Tax=Saprolegnia parasitica (strain CBS 223.65) TaxID=695850 RepID=A0A067CAG6_SAPPC|nr:hypothetical protein SPRG_08521 [Saprolegnia parasitica CBS 223.65]KDO26160.1 hypothetical protein SPRG_08521 [Saprolegnia parasitica CBS 223.65]|eukprot:XP_012203154.1 hypothetical protein SPRG_08521 [Saprolegnia parasitica CBS 223.65]
MNKRARCGVALDVGIILEKVVMCMRSPQDVRAFLEALPVAMLPPTLAALLALLRLPAGNAMWPIAPLCIMARVAPKLALAASRLYTSASLDITFEDHVVASHDSVGYAHPFCAFVAQWAGTIHTMKLLGHRRISDAFYEELSSVLRRCTKLAAVRLCNNLSVLSAVTTAAHTVQTLSLNYGPFPRFDGGNAKHVASWLNSGHARQLTLMETPWAHPDLAAALASTTTLSSLSLIHCNSVLGSLALSRSISSLTVVFTGPVFNDRVPLLHWRHLTTLTLHGDGGRVPNLVPALSSMVALKSLRLSRMHLQGLAQAAQYPDLRAITLDNLTFSDDGFRAIVGVTTCSDRLESIKWTVCAHGRTMDLVDAALGRWLQSGVRRVVFVAGASSLRTPRRWYRLCAAPNGATSKAPM